MLNGLLSQIIDVFFLPGDFLAGMSLVPRLFGPVPYRSDLTVMLSSGFWGITIVIAYRIYGYCRSIFRHVVTRIDGWRNSVQRIIRVQRTRALCATPFFNAAQSPEDTIQMEAIDLDGASQKILAIAWQGSNDTTIDCGTLAQQLHLSRHKVRRTCDQLEMLQFLKRAAASSNANPTYQLTPGGRLYLQVSKEHS